MNRKFIAWGKTAPLTLLLGMLPEAAMAFDYQGQNTFTLEHYNVDGNLARGLYADEGFQRHNDLNINFWDSYTPYSSMRGYVQASSNHSDYRQPEGGRLNSAAVHYENGELGLPFRVDVGDFFATQSRRTLQRGLKGLQAEFQPVSSHTPQSLQLFWGRSAENYDTFFDERKDYFYGASWLADITKLGSFSLTHVRYYDDTLVQSDGSEGGEEGVSSLAWYKSIDLGRFTHMLEAEFAYLSGENQSSDSLSGQGEFIHVSGFSREGSDYLISYERNDEEFRPQGASLTPDRESIDLQYGQKLYGLMKARVRAQKYRDQLSSENISSTKIAGLTLLGRPVEKWALNVNMDLSFRDESNEDDTRDRDTVLASLNLSLPVSDAWRNRFSYQWQESDDQTIGNTSQRQFVSLGADFSQSLLAWETTLSPTLNYNEDRDGANQETSNSSVGISMSAAREGHSLLLSHQARTFLTDSSQANDSHVAQSRFQWRYTWQDHTLAFNADHYDYAQDALPDEEAASTKLSLAWTMKFAKPKPAPIEIDRNVASLTAFTSLADIQLNRYYDDSFARSIEAAGWRETGTVGDMSLYEGDWIAGIENRQVLAFEQSGSAIRSANMLIEFDSQTPEERALEYDRVLDELLKRFGQPSRQRNVGEFAPGWTRSLAENSFIRITEWQLPNGILRFGIPEATQGPVRMEAQLKSVHGGLEESDWGLNLRP